MSEEEYQQRLKKIKEDEKKGKISSSQARAKIWLLDLEREEAEQASKKKKDGFNNDEFDNNESEDNESEDDKSEDDETEDDESKDDESEDDESEDDESKDDDKDGTDNNKDDKEQDKNDDKRQNSDEQKNNDEDLNNKNENSSNKSDSANGNSNKTSQEDIPNKRSLNNQGTATPNMPSSQPGINPAASTAGTSGAGSGAAGAASTGTGGAAGGASAGAGSAAGGAGFSMGPALGYVLLFIVVVIIMIGIVFFFIGMPGMVIGKIGEAILKMREKFEILFDGDNAANIMVDREDVANAATYLMQMGYDLGGYGFLDDEVKQKVVALASDGLWAKLKEWWTSPNPEDSANLSFRIFNSNFQTFDVTKSNKYAKTIGGDPENTANLYLSEKFTDIKEADPKDVNSKILLAINPNSEVRFCKSKYLGMYLTADNATYLLRNQNTSIGNRLAKIIAVNDTTKGSGLIHFWNASEINPNKYIDNIEGGVELANPEGFFGYDRVAVLRSQRLLKIKNAKDGGWFFKQTYYTYDLDYITKYGFPLQLALALHLSTMAPDFAYTVAKRGATETMVNLALLETENNYISMAIKLDFDNDGIYENYRLEQKTMMKTHKSSKTGDEEAGYTTEDDAMKAALNLLVEDETKEELENEIQIEKENQKEEIITEEDALKILEDDLKIESASFEANKIPITFYYNAHYENNFKKYQGSYDEPIWDADFPLQAVIIDAGDASEALSKIMKYLVEYNYAEYKKNEEGEKVGIAVKEEAKENENVKKIKKLFTTYFRNSYFNEYFKEDKIELGGITLNSAVPKELRNKTLDQITEGLGTEGKDYYIAQTELMDQNSIFGILESVEANKEWQDKIEKEWGEMTDRELGTNQMNEVTSYYGRPVFMAKCQFEENQYTYVMLVEDSEEDIDGKYEDKMLFYDKQDSLYGYSKATCDEIWNYFIEGKELNIKDVTKRYYWPWRKYYRLIDEEGNVLTFENENKEGTDFVYVEGADSYYVSDKEPKGWFWRNAIPKKIASAIVKSVYGYDDEKTETYLNNPSNAKDIMLMLKNMAEVNTKGFTRYLPFITSVTDHWYEDLDFSGCYEWVQTDTPITERYPYEAEKNDSSLVKAASNKNLLTVIETIPGKLQQKAEPKVAGESGQWIRNLIDNEKYYIYDGTGKSEEAKYIKFTDVAIDVIAMLEQINGEASQHIIRIFKELLSSYNIVFEESENTTLKKKLFCSVIASYSDENNLYTEGDSCVFYAKTAIKEKGFEYGLDVMTPIASRVVYRSADSVGLEIIAPGEEFDGYTILITGFQVDDNISLDDELQKGHVIGKTIRQDIKLVLRDADGAIVKNSYSMLSGTNFENFAKVFDEKSYKLTSGEGCYFYESSEHNIEGFKEDEKLVIPISGTITEKTDSSITIKNNSSTHKEGEAYIDYTVTISGIKVDSSLQVGQKVSRKDKLGTTTTEDIVIVLKDTNGNTISEKESYIAESGTYGYDTSFTISQTEQENAIAIYEYLSEKGYNDNAIYAVLGNMYQESRWDSTAIEKNKNKTEDKQRGHGLIQWTNNRNEGYENGRWYALKAYADQQGVEWTDMNMQLNYLVIENSWIQLHEQAVYKGPDTNLTEFLNNSHGLSINQLTEEFYYCAERPDITKDSSLPIRTTAANKAKQIIEAYKAENKN